MNPDLIKALIDYSRQNAATSGAMNARPMIAPNFTPQVGDMSVPQQPTMVDPNQVQQQNMQAAQRGAQGIGSLFNMFKPQQSGLQMGQTAPYADSYLGNPFGMIGNF